MEIEGLVLPFVMPILHAARALARTLTGTPTDLSYPAMPILVKTNAYPVVVSPPAAGLAGPGNKNARAAAWQRFFTAVTASCKDLP